HLPEFHLAAVLEEISSWLPVGESCSTKIQPSTHQKAPGSNPRPRPLNPNRQRPCAEMDSYPSYSPNGNAYLAIVGDESLHVRQSAYSQPIRVIEFDSCSPCYAGFSPDGQIILTVDHDYKDGTTPFHLNFKTWDAATGNLIRVVRSFEYPADPDPAVRNRIHNCVGLFFPDGQTLALLAMGNVFLYGVDGTFIEELDAGSASRSDMFDSLIMSTNGETLFRTGFHPHAVNVKDGSTVFEFDATNIGLAVSPLGDRLATAQGNEGIGGHCGIWDSRYGDPVMAIQGFPGYVTSVAFSPDGKRLACGGDNGDVKVFDSRLSWRAMVLGYHRSPISSVWLGDDEQVICSRDTNDNVQTWDLKTGAQLEPAPDVTPVDGTMVHADENGGTSGFMTADGTTVVSFSESELLMLQRTEDYDDLWAEDALRRKAQAPAIARRNAEASEEAHNWFAAAFHLRRLRELAPDEPGVAERLKKAEEMLAAEKQSKNK
ncbi:MAG: WD40 repeat domain-containing protein, partial [Planctomycetaceae bacterium]|nr:WD40 repeat domain-containing protein [Planctomycetaceae bacterium]